MENLTISRQYYPDNDNASSDTTSINTSSVFNEEEYLRMYLGEKYLDIPTITVLTIVYILIFLSGTIGNVCTCIVIARNRNMHTATNYYLFSLAVSDLCTLLLALPQELYTFWEAYPWKLGEAVCILKNFVTEMSAYASILTITAFTIERWAAICHPMRFQKLSNLSRAIKVIIIVWIVSILCALPYAVHTRTFYALVHPVTSQPLLDSLLCNVPHTWQELMQVILQISTFVFFVLPMTLITIIYILIGITLYKSEIIGIQKNPVNVTNSNGKISNADKKAFDTSQARKSVLKMLVAVVVAFFACWAPFHAQRLWTIYMHREQWTPELLDLQNHIFFLSGVLYFFSATVNPILYNVMSKKYRQAFKQTLCCCIPSKYNENNKSMYGSSYSPSHHKNYGYSKISRAPMSQTFTIVESVESKDDVHAL